MAFSQVCGFVPFLILFNVSIFGLSIPRLTCLRPMSCIFFIMRSARIMSVVLLSVHILKLVRLFSDIRSTILSILSTSVNTFASQIFSILRFFVVCIILSSSITFSGLLCRQLLFTISFEQKEHFILQTLDVNTVSNR